MPFSHQLLALCCVILWGLNFVAIKIGLDGFPPLLLCACRFFLTCFPAIFFFRRPAIPFRKIFFYGIVMFAIQFALLFVGINIGAPPGLSSLLMQTQVFFSVLLAILLFNERLKVCQIVGGVIACSGIGYVAMHVGGHFTLAGFLCVVSAALFWGFGNVLSKHIGHVNRVALVAWASFVAWPLLLLASLVMEGPQTLICSFQNISWLSTGIILYIAYPTTLFAFAAWNWLIHHHPLASVAPFTLLVPIFGMTSSSLLLGEPFQLWKAMAALLIIGGMGINVIGPRFFRK